MRIHYDADNSEDLAKTPILASIFNVFGCLVALATTLVVIAAFSSGEKIAHIPLALLIGGAGGLVALVFFGIGQLLVSIARIELYASTEKNAAILHSLHKIEGHLASMREVGRDA